MDKEQTAITTETTERELPLRRRLGIPDDAGSVIVFAESSHWDPDWMRTSDEYFKLVGRNLDAAIEALQREPRRIYSIECMFFLRMYWERRPERRDAVRALVNEGRLRLTSSGVTTADTLLPRSEAVLRDMLQGQEWLRANGMTQEPRMAYFTDSFGCSPALPSLLRAAGFDRTAITRVDGMFFMGADYERRRRFPRPGSSAELLLKRERTLDFIWRGPDEAEVLCHWNAFTYGQGDLITYHGIGRMYEFPLAIVDRSDRHVTRQIQRFASRLAPLSRTPYLFCPIGFDFVAPIRDLVSLLDRYNRNHYHDKGLWAVNAGLDDYLELVDCRRGRLPSMELDPNPYWTGFYTARPSLKRRCHELTDGLLLAERLALLPGNEDAVNDIEGELADAWWTAATANHHDFITGTSPDRVAEGEQVPWLERAAAMAETAISRLAPDAVPHTSDGSTAGAIKWTDDGGPVRIETPHYAIELSGDDGGAIVCAHHPDSGKLLLTGPSNDIISYSDSGGLWRMGQEFHGGVFSESSRSGDRPATLDVIEHEGAIEVTCDSIIDGETVRRSMWFSGDSPVIRMRVEGRAVERRTVTVRFDSGVAADGLAMDQPGGAVIRPPRKIYDPTFWPMQSFVHILDGASGRGVALFTELPSAVSYRPDGRIELIALRNAVRERAFGFLPIPANPAIGHEREPCIFDYSIMFTPSGDWRENGIPAIARKLLETPWDDAGRAALRRLAASVTIVDRPDVFVTVVKPASRGDGIIVRLETLTAAGSPVALTLGGRTVRAAFLCDARERDIEPLVVRDGSAVVVMPGNIVTARLLV
ncbi:MAG: hypothetical protein U9N44_03040 [Chloroflexota bacterium]|nr:hypothetical protein [Chloroflexota bacterium]